MGFRASRQSAQLRVPPPAVSRFVSLSCGGGRVTRLLLGVACGVPVRFGRFLPCRRTSFAVLASFALHLVRSSATYCESVKLTELLLLLALRQLRGAPWDCLLNELTPLLVMSGDDSKELATKDVKSRLVDPPRQNSACAKYPQPLTPSL